MNIDSMLGLSEALRLQLLQVAVAASKSIAAAKKVVESPARAVHEYLQFNRLAAFERSTLSRVCFDWRELDPMGDHFPDLCEYGLGMPDDAIDYSTGRPYGYRHPTSGLRSPTVVFVFSGTDERGDRISSEVRMLDPFGVPTDEAIDVARRWAIDTIELGNRIVSAKAAPSEPRFPEPSRGLSPKAAAVREILLDAWPTALRGGEICERLKQRGLNESPAHLVDRILPDLELAGCPIENDGAGYYLRPLGVGN